MAPVKRGFQKAKGQDVHNVHNKVQQKKKCVRKQIRDTERLLRLELPEKMMSIAEEKLQELKRIQTEVKREQNRLADRYKQVKFIERRKVERQIRRAERELRNASDECKAEAAEKLQELNRDLEYIKYFPRTERYISLYKTGDDDKAAALREKFRKEIQEQIEAGMAVEDSEEDYPVAMSEDDFFLRDDDDDAKVDANNAPETRQNDESKTTRRNESNTTRRNEGNASMEVKKTGLTTKPQKRARESVAEKSEPTQAGVSQSEQEKRKRKRKRPKKK